MKSVGLQRPLKVSSPVSRGCDLSFLQCEAALPSMKQNILHIWLEQTHLSPLVCVCDTEVITHKMTVFSTKSMTVVVPSNSS